jgi:hypothetical protein
VHVPHQSHNGSFIAFRCLGVASDRVEFREVTPGEGKPYLARLTASNSRSGPSQTRVRTPNDGGDTARFDV